MRQGAHEPQLRQTRPADLLPACSDRPAPVAAPAGFHALPLALAAAGRQACLLPQQAPQQEGSEDGGGAGVVRQVVQAVPAVQGR
jgi:hypothetical protein